jgi:hypothetical protein
MVAGFLLASGPAFAQKAVPFTAAPWKGEFFTSKQGGLYVKMLPKNFAASQQTKFLTGNVRLTVYNLLTKRLYIVSHSFGDIEGFPREIWKLTSGKYEIRSIEMVDMAGQKRRWVSGPRSRKTFVVPRQSISNLGLWTLKPLGKDKLSVKFDMIPNSYAESSRKGESSVAAVVDGFSGLIQERFGGKKVIEGSGDGYSNNKQLRATITFTRKISMFYALNLFRHNYVAQEVSNVLVVYDPNIRRCFTDRLQEKEDLRGDVKFTFLLSKATGTMNKVKNTGGTASDPKLVKCMYLELGQMQFPIKENIVGEVTYTFDVN